MIKLSSLCPSPSQWNSTTITASQGPALHISSDHHQVTPTTAHYVWIREGHIERVGFNRYSSASITPETGAAAHMSLHLFNNVKEPTKIPAQPPTPISQGPQRTSLSYPPRPLSQRPLR